MLENHLIIYSRLLSSKSVDEVEYDGDLLGRLEGIKSFSICQKV